VTMESSANRRRIVALWLARLPTDRLQRRWRANAHSAPPEAKDAPPLVIAAKDGNVMRLSAVDRKAAALGLSAGMPLANARAMLPVLDVRIADEPEDRALLECIADWCGRFTPFIALDPPHSLLLDVTGVAHLFGGERTMLDRMRASLSQQGFAIRAALAGSAAAARGLARYANGVIVPPGEDAAAVAALPIEALRFDAGILHAVRRAGLKTIGAVAARKRSELTSRFGGRMVAMLDAVSGQTETPISPRAPIPDYSAEHRFAEPIVTEDAVMRTLHLLTEALSTTLTERGEGARRLEAVFFRADGAVRRIVIETGEPARDYRIIQRLFREKLDALSDPLDPGFGYDLIRLEAARVERADGQTLHFDSDAQAEKDLRFLIDRLAARFGSNRILSFHPNNTHIPEAAFVALPAQYARPTKPAWQKLRGPKEAPRRPLRLFAKPEPVEMVPEITLGPPVQFRWRRVLHHVARAEGPERIAMEWWRHQNPQPARDYYRVEDCEGSRFWLYRETAFPRWYMHGLFS